MINSTDIIQEIDNYILLEQEVLNIKQKLEKNLKNILGKIN